MRHDSYGATIRTLVQQLSDSQKTIEKLEVGGGVGGRGEGVAGATSDVTIMIVSDVDKLLILSI